MPAAFTSTVEARQQMTSARCSKRKKQASDVLNEAYTREQGSSGGIGCCTVTILNSEHPILFQQGIGNATLYYVGSC